MITLPASPAPNGAQPFVVDTGLTQRGGVGASITRIDRPGMHMGAEFSFPPMLIGVARIFISRLMEAKSAGLIVEWPLLGQDQGNPGVPLVDITPGLSAGTVLHVKGLTQGYPVKEGYWINVHDAGGDIFLHNVRTLVHADVNGKATLSVWPPLRSVFADNDIVAIRQPEMAGAVTSDIRWPLPAQRFVDLSFTLEEAR